MNMLNSRPVSFYILTALIFFQAASGLFGGAALMLDPTGSSLQMPNSLLEDSPFGDYLIPGIILFFVLGVFPSIVCYGLLRREKWSWLGALLVGIALVIWIGTEIAMVGYHADPPLQLIYGVVGIAILGLTQLPSFKRLQAH
jgi:Kef-type K+ transport system membrane component KefB